MLICFLVWAGFLLGTRQTLLETKDGGKSWAPRSIPSAEDEDFNYRFNSISFCGNEGWIVGKPSILLHTTDAGTSWERIPLSARLPGNPVSLQKRFWFSSLSKNTLESLLIKVFICLGAYQGNGGKKCRDGHRWGSNLCDIQYGLQLESSCRGDCFGHIEPVLSLEKQNSFFFLGIFYLCATVSIAMVSGKVWWTCWVGSCSDIVDQGFHALAPIEDL